MFTREQKIGFLKELLDEFETEDMRLYCEDMIETIPDYFFTIPSSTSLKYHNEQQYNICGQIYHVLMFGAIMNYRLALKCNKEKYPKEKQRDAMRCVPIFHDAWKCGNNSSFTVHKHPLLAGEWVRNTNVKHDIKPPLKNYIANMCERHSGEYTTSNRDKTILPEPETDEEIFCHECDILSSRNNIDMDLSDYIKEYTNAVIESMISSYKMDFGKYNGQTIKETFEEHSDYFEWLEQQKGGMREPMKTIINKLREEERL